MPQGRKDQTTGLPNRNQFRADYMSMAGTQLVMLTLIGAQQFTQLLRAIGHEYAEEFIRAGAVRLAEALPPGVQLYYVGMLSFAFQCPQGARPEVLRRLHAHLRKPLLCGGIPVTAEIAIGLAECTDSNPANVLRAAMAAAEDCRDGGTEWARYNRKLDTARQRGFLILSQLHTALNAADQLYLVYQPKFSLATGRICGAEALLRWRHPALGMISPAEFIPLAEATAHIHTLTDWVLRHAITQSAAWAARHLETCVAINVSPRNLGKRGFAGQVAQMLRAFGVQPGSIELEFTEGVLCDDPAVLEELQTLRDLGVRIAIDDFGTGFANFSYITHLPADSIKIDRCFIQSITGDERAARVVHSLIELAHQLDYTVIAEGVETETARRMLAEWQCDEGQGYHLSPPLEAADFARKFSPSALAV